MWYTNLKPTGLVVKKIGRKFIALVHSKIFKCSKITFYLILSHFRPKNAKYKSRECKKELIYCEILEKIPLWADFSKAATVAILKIPIFWTRDCPKMIHKIKKEGCFWLILLLVLSTVFYRSNSDLVVRFSWNFYLVIWHL